MELADILSKESVLVCSGRKTKTEVLRKLAERAAEATNHDVETIFEALSDREALGSTGLGNGIAIPHGKLVGLPGVAAVFMRLEEPIDFEAVDDQPVDLLMMLLAPVGAGADHLRPWPGWRACCATNPPWMLCAAPRTRAKSTPS